LAALAIPLSAGTNPYQWLIDENGRRSRDEPEFELMDTGVFDQGRYWAVDVAYAKASATEILAKITIKNHASEAATLSVLPTLWFRNTWRVKGEEPPRLFLDGDGIAVDHPRLSGYRLDAAATSEGVHPVVPEFAIEYPTGSGKYLALRDIAGDLADRLVSIWLPGPDGRRPVYGGVELLQSDPAWKDNLLFFEYFHGDNGAGLGAMHQTGWTSVVADLLLNPPHRTQRLIFVDETSATPDEAPIAAGPAG
jgi:hypothetical protein